MRPISVASRGGGGGTNATSSSANIAVAIASARVTHRRIECTLGDMRAGGGPGGGGGADPGGCGGATKPYGGEGGGGGSSSSSVFSSCARSLRSGEGDASDSEASVIETASNAGADASAFASLRLRVSRVVGMGCPGSGG